MATHRKAINKFWSLALAGKSCALDVNTMTGVMTVRYSISGDGSIGNGAPPIPYSNLWARVITSDEGHIIIGSER